MRCVAVLGPELEVLRDRSEPRVRLSPSVHIPRSTSVHCTQYGNQTARTMHQVLETPELARLIIRSGRTRATTLALALTCRAFLEPSMDILWEVLMSLAPLVRCLPSDLWTTDDDGTIMVSWGYIPSQCVQGSRLML